MAHGPGWTTLKLLYRSAGPAGLDGQTDAELLRRGTSGGPAAEAAFDALLRRHGPLVWRVCRAALRNPADAEDAFQATFLVLARRAPSLSLRGPLGPWLYGVARRISARARSAAALRSAHERQAAAARATTYGPPGDGGELAELVHRAVGRLPASQRAAVLLCDLGGLTYQEAAERLGWTPAALRNRLARARSRLRAALVRVGVVPAVALAHEAVAPVPRALAAATARAAALTAAGAVPSGISESVILLVNGGFQAMLLTKFKTLSFSALTAGVLFAGAVGLSGQSLAPQPTPRPTPAATTPALAPVALDLNADAEDPAVVEDLGETIAALARRAQKLRREGDLPGAARVMRQIEQTAARWRTKLDNEQEVRLLRDRTLKAQKLDQEQAELRAVERRLEAARNADERRAAELRLEQLRNAQGRAGQQAGPTPATTPRPAFTSTQPAPRSAPDVEARLREVERKLDRLLKALEAERDKDVGTRNPNKPGQ